MNIYDMEINSRQELLTSFKQSYGGSMQRIRRLLEKFCPDMSEKDVQNFIYIFFPFMFGIYPYTSVTDKQRVAMEEAEIHYVYQTSMISPTPACSGCSASNRQKQRILSYGGIRCSVMMQAVSRNVRVLACIIIN